MDRIRNDGLFQRFENNPCLSLPGIDSKPSEVISNRVAVERPLMAGNCQGSVDSLVQGDGAGCCK
jgi:hypothetical protein